MHRLILSCAHLAIGGILALSTALLQGGEPSETPIALTSDVVLRKVLDETTCFDFQDLPLQEVVQRIGQRHHIQIILDKPAFEGESVGPETPITCNLRGISLRSALRILLREHKLTWFVEDEVMHITLRSECGGRCWPRIYDVSDLIKDGRAGDYETLIKTITAIVAPTTWDDVGGPASIARFPLLDRTLIISQGIEIHVEIDAFLAEIRRFRKALEAPSSPP